MLNNNVNVKKPILLCILDGWGIGDPNSPHNAISQAKTPNYDRILANYPHAQLSTSGLDVGLPDGQIGNSEVGHVSIGSGRIIFQDLPRINNAISDNSLEHHPDLQNLIKACQVKRSCCHLMGLFSDGGVHSHQNHLIALSKILAKNDVQVKIHAFLDGRDVAQKSAIKYLKDFFEQTKDYAKNIAIATISGRYYAMDRDHNWERIKLAYDVIIDGNQSQVFQEQDSIQAVEKSYQNNITDEFIKPLVINGYSGIKNGDGLIFANFRSDRARELSLALLDPEFNYFPVRKINFCAQVSLTEYSDKLNQYFRVLFPSIVIKNSLGEVLQNLGLKQLRVAETEKYAHVTFFFSGGREEKFIGEERILIKSPAVATYDLMPEMAAREVGKQLKLAIISEQYDFIVVNYANPDMVGHSGILQSSIKACEIIDEQLGILSKAILEQDGLMLICADHGNIESLIDNNGYPHTSHTNNPVPLVLIANQTNNLKLKDGKLSDIAPTILALMSIVKPKEMTGESLLIEDNKV